ncbi:MAG: biotin--[acetyl-CoA-carboxylase] ligase [Candidatus Omnitrophica bacterium]|nr:biotin--[acetyl-CoA-carboxylase] ligase [Candidatus Omnitrophota bacterium]
MREKILDLLKRKTNYISGDFLAQRLGISRQALWKHIQDLKELGYDIVAVPHLGYRLQATPDRLFDCEVSRNLNTRILGRKIYYFESITSTMDAAMELGIKGAPEGSVVIAEAQTRGRGRLGRVWFSPKYKGIYFSVILRPKLAPANISILTLLAAVSVVEAVKKIAGVDTEIKWPNDILLENKKLGGILTELNAEMDKVNFVIIGIGLNVNNDKRFLPSGAISLKEKSAQETSRIELLQEILRRLETNYFILGHKGSKAIIERWREYAITLHRRVKVYCQGQYIEGEVVNIDTDGGLLVRKDSGVIQKIFSGDLIHCS